MLHRLPMAIVKLNDNKSRRCVREYAKLHIKPLGIDPAIYKYVSSSTALYQVILVSRGPQHCISKFLELDF